MLQVNRSDRGFDVSSFIVLLLNFEDNLLKKDCLAEAEAGDS